MNKSREYCIVGLGNPGKAYQSTRHNVGFMFLDYLAGRLGETYRSSKWEAELIRCDLFGERVLLVKPSTFMNLSGRAVTGIISFYQIPETRLVVVHDDLDMAFGRVKVASGGGAGGHKGIRSITEMIGTPDFIRVKVGIGRPGSGETHPEMPVDAYVLSPFSPNEIEVLQQRFKQLEEGLGPLLAGDLSRSMTALNRIR